MGERHHNLKEGVITQVLTPLTLRGGHHVGQSPLGLNDVSSSQHQKSGPLGPEGRAVGFENCRERSELVCLAT